MITEDGNIELISQVVKNLLSIPCNVLMGANLAGEIADEKFSETTIGKFWCEVAALYDYG